MCVHLTKSGDICKRSPGKFLCSVHALNPEFTLVHGKVGVDHGEGVADIIEINGHSALFFSNGAIGEISAEEVAALIAPTTPAAPVREPRKPFGKVRCGKCHEIHDSVNAVKVCYLQARRESE